MNGQKKLVMECCIECGEWLGTYLRDGELRSRNLCDPCQNFDPDEDYRGGDRCCPNPCIHIDLEVISEEGDSWTAVWHPYELSAESAYFSREEIDRIARQHNAEVAPASEDGDYVECCNCGTDLLVRED